MRRGASSPLVASRTCIALLPPLILSHLLTALHDTGVSHGGSGFEPNAVDTSAIIVLVIWVVYGDFVFMPSERCTYRVDDVLVRVSRLGQQFLDA